MLPAGLPGVECRCNAAWSRYAIVHSAAAGPTYTRDPARDTRLGQFYPNKRHHYRRLKSLEKSPRCFSNQNFFCPVILGSP